MIQLFVNRVYTSYSCPREIAGSYGYTLRNLDETLTIAERTAKRRKITG